MTRLLLALAGVLLLALTALTLIWLAGQLLAGLGAFVVGAAGVLLRLLGFLLLAGGLGGLAYFLASAWRPAAPPSATGRDSCVGRDPGFSWENSFRYNKRL